MNHVLLFNLLLLGASALAIARGGAPERTVGVLLVSAALGTALLQSHHSVRFVGVEDGVATIDVALFAMLVTVALLADRFWTLWMAALQGIGTASHVVRMVDPGVLRFVYALLAEMGSYPMILLLVVATVRHQRRLRRWGRTGDDAPAAARGDSFGTMARQEPQTYRRRSVLRNQVRAGGPSDDSSSTMRSQP